MFSSTPTLSNALLVGLVLLCAALSIALAIVWVYRRRYTRERFAFVGLVTLASLASLSLLSLKFGPPWDLIGVIMGQLLEFEYQPKPPGLIDYLFILLLLVLVSQTIQRLHLAWEGSNGGISLDQHERNKRHEPSNLFVEAAHELKRVVRHHRVVRYIPGPSTLFLAPLDWPNDTLAWHLQAIDLLQLRQPSYGFDRETDWHEQYSCWIGRNRRTGATVGVLCSQRVPDHETLERFVSYTSAIAASAAGAAAERIVAVRDVPTSLPTIGTSLRFESEESLLERLVSFEDYFDAIRRRVERDTLPDSEVTIADMYVESHFTLTGQDEPHPVTLEAYIAAWSQEAGQRQLALLGEYGQGKSTSALMFTHHAIQCQLATTGGRVPILIELRGKSPRNMTPEEILAAWAMPYDINPRALDKLLRAGRLLLILEGFDEMALIGDAEMRLSHFRTLWKLCYPKAKILITGRPNLFLDDAEMKASLGIDMPRGTGPYCEALVLVPFDPPDMRKALRKFPSSIVDEIVDLAQRNERFREIVARPSLLYLVARLWKTENLAARQAQIDSALVMELFVRHCYQRQTAKTGNSTEFMVLTEGERAFFMEGIAAHIASKRLPNQITAAQLADVVERLYAIIPDSISYGGNAMTGTSANPLRQRLANAQNPADDVHTDVRACGLLVSDSSRVGAFKFAHKSFFEFLFAKVMADNLGARTERISALTTACDCSLSDLIDHPQSLYFMSELIAARVRSEWSAADLDPNALAYGLFLQIVLRGRLTLTGRVIAYLVLWGSVAQKQRRLRVIGVLFFSLPPIVLASSLAIFGPDGARLRVVLLFTTISMVMMTAVMMEVISRTASRPYDTRWLIWFSACQVLSVPLSAMRRTAGNAGLEALSEDAGRMERGLRLRGRG